MFVDFNILNQLGSPSINSNTFANRPAAGQTGRLFVSTDTFEIYRDNGTGWDLIGGPGSSTVTGSGAAGQVTYWTGTNTVSGENALFWDAAQNHLGINTATPGVALDVHSAADIALQLNGTGATPTVLQQFLSAGVAQYELGYNWNASADYRRFSIYDTAGAKEVISIDQQSRYVGINYQYSSLSDQPAYTLDVSGSGRFADSALFNTTGGSTLLGTTTDFTTITQGGLIKINGFGIYPFTQNDLTTNTTLITGAILQNATAFSGTNGASGQEFASIFSAPLLSNNSSGGTNANTINGIYITPTFSATSGTAPNNINGIVSNCYRITSTDTSTGSGNVVGMRVNVRTAPPAPSTVANSNLGAILATATNNSGTSSQVFSLRSQVSTGTSGANTSNTTSYMAHIRADNFNVGAASGNTGTVANGYGIFLSGANVLATGTLTNYYALYQGAANVTGTLTNRWGIYIDDTSAKNYFGGNTLIGTTTDAGEKLQVTGKVLITDNTGINVTNGDPFTRNFNKMFGISSTVVNGFASVGINGGLAGSAQLDLGANNVLYGNISASITEVQLKTLTSIPINFLTNNTQRAQISSGGNFLIKTTTDSGFPLVVATVGGDAVAILLSGDGSGNSAIKGGGGNLDIWSPGGDVTLRYNNSGGTKTIGLAVKNSTGNVEIPQGSIKTAAPTTGTAAQWKLGSRVAAAVVLDATQYIELDVGGTLYKLAIVT